MIAPCDIESVLNPVQCFKKNKKVQESDFCSIYILGSLIKWKIKIICEKENGRLWFHSVPTFLTSSSPVTGNRTFALKTYGNAARSVT